MHHPSMSDSIARFRMCVLQCEAHPKAWRSEDPKEGFAWIQPRQIHRTGSPAMTAFFVKHGKQPNIRCLNSQRNMNISNCLSHTGEVGGSMHLGAFDKRANCRCNDRMRLTTGVAGLTRLHLVERILGLSYHENPSWVGQRCLRFAVTLLLYHTAFMRLLECVFLLESQVQAEPS